jgi:TetR/AcrR family transcriptional regulator, cholesterol catabolism regulator
MARSRSTDSVALVEAAAGVFESKGYRNATIDDIADAAGVSRPTVYKYTSSKRALLDSLVDAVCDDLEQRLDAVVNASSEPAPVRVRRVVAMHIDSAVRRRSFYAIVFSEQVELSEQAKSRFHRFSHKVAVDFQRLLEECIAQRPPAASVRVDTLIAANLVLSMLTTLYRWYDPEGKTSPAQLTEQVLAVLSGVVPAFASLPVG